MKKHLTEAKTFGGSVIFYLPCVIKHVRTYEMILTYNLRIRNTDPRYKKHFLGFK